MTFRAEISTLLIIKLVAVFLIGRVLFGNPLDKQLTHNDIRDNLIGSSPSIVTAHGAPHD